MARPGIGSKTEAPLRASSSARSSALSLTATLDPNRARNMLPFTNAARFPNMGRDRTLGSSGTRESKYAFDASSAFGMDMPTAHRLLEALTAANHRAVGGGERIGPSRRERRRRPQT